MPDDILAALPVELGWGLIVALLVRGFVQSIPKIVDSVSRAMTERALAARLKEQVRLTEAETVREDGQERRDLAHRLDAMEEKLRETEEACAAEIAKTHRNNELTSERLTAVEGQHAKCERRLKDQDDEMKELRASIQAMR